MSADPISFETVLDAQRGELPSEVKEQISELWGDNELGNDDCYFKFNTAFEEAREYPIIAEYLKSRGVERCLIHYWW